MSDPEQQAEEPHNEFDFSEDDEQSLAEAWADIRENGWDAIPDGF